MIILNLAGHGLVFVAHVSTAVHLLTLTLKMWDVEAGAERFRIKRKTNRIK
jgi:hypothetical protein